jgi:hypothetical protein
MLNIIRHQGNANQIPMRFHLTTVRMAIAKKQSKTKNNAGEDVEKKEPICTAGGNVS